MNVTFRWMGRQTLCSCCEKPIMTDTPVVVHSWRNKRGYTGRLYYHPDCFTEKYLFKLKMEQPKPYRFGRGRKSLGLSDEQKKRRRTLQQKARRGTISPEEQEELDGQTGHDWIPRGENTGADASPTGTRYEASVVLS